MTGVVGQDANQHDGIVLDVGRGARRVGEQLTDSNGGFAGGVGAGFGILDYGGEVDKFRTLQ